LPVRQRDDNLSQVHAPRPTGVRIVKVHLVDGTYELFRAFFGAPSSRGRDGSEVGATRAFGRSMLYLLGDSEVSHVAVAFDHVIESFRNDLFDGYKTGAGIEPTLFSQFELAERMTHALGLVTWSMVEFEADDAIAAFAARAADDERVEQVVICSPDKDMAQCVRGDRVICWDRMRNKRLNEAAIPLTASPGSNAGVRSRRRRCCTTTSTSNRSPIKPRRGRSAFAERPRWRARSRRRDRKRRCTNTWRPYASTFPSTNS
jgi:hypothetical protein